MRNLYYRLLPLLLSVAPSLVSGQQHSGDTVSWEIDLDDVVVTASYTPTSSRSAVHQVKVIDKQDIDRFQARNLQQLLLLDAGLRIQEDRFLGSKTNLLGIGGQNVKVLIDGVPVIGRLDGNIDFGQIHLNNVERVEIVEGPLAVNYGTDALAGVINIITKKSQLETWSVLADAAYEDRGERSTSLQLGYRPSREWYINIQGGLDNFPGWDTDSTRASVWKPKSQQYVNGLVRLLPNNVHDLKYQFNWLDERVLNEGDIRRPQFRPYAFDEEYLTKRQDHALHYHGNYGNGWNLWSFIAYNSFDRKVATWRKDIETGEQLELPSNQDTSFIQSWNWRTTASRQLPGASIHYQIGLDVRYDDTKGTRIEGADSLSTYMLDNAVFGSVRYSPFSSLIVEAGMRYAYNNRYTTPLTPSLNLRYEISNTWTARASYGKGFRAPDIKELFFNFIDVNHFIVGNQDLQPETSHNFQLSLTYQKKSNGRETSFNIRSFFNDISDKIELFEFVESGGGFIPAVDTVTNNYTYFNLDQFRTKGIGVRFGHSTRIWSIDVGYNLIGQFDPGLSEAFQKENRYTYNNELIANARYRLPWINTDLNLLIRMYDRLVSFYPTENDNGAPVLGKRIQQGFTNLDLMLGRTFWKNRIRVNAGARNLLDVQTRNITGDTGEMHTAQSVSLPVSPGRRYFASISIRLGE